MAPRNLRPEHQGQLKHAAWMAYVNQFRLLSARLDHPIENEAWHWVMARIPESIRTPILREQVKRNNREPQARLAGVQGIPIDGVASLFRDAVGPEWAYQVRLTVQSTGYLVDLPSKVALERLLASNGRVLQSGHAPKISLVEPKMPLHEGF